MSLSLEIRKLVTNFYSHPMSKKTKPGSDPWITNLYHYLQSNNVRNSLFEVKSWVENKKIELPRESPLGKRKRKEPQRYTPTPPDPNDKKKAKKEKVINSYPNSTPKIAKKVTKKKTNTSKRAVRPKKVAKQKRASTKKPNKKKIQVQINSSESDNENNFEAEEAANNDHNLNEMVNIIESESDGDDVDTAILDMEENETIDTNQNQNNTNDIGMEENVNMNQNQNNEEEEFYDANENLSNEGNQSFDPRNFNFSNSSNIIDSILEGSTSSDYGIILTSLARTGQVIERSPNLSYTIPYLKQVFDNTMNLIRSEVIPLNPQQIMSNSSAQRKNISFIELSDSDESK